MIENRYLGSSTQGPTPALPGRDVARVLLAILIGIAAVIAVIAVVGEIVWALEKHNIYPHLQRFLGQMPGSILPLLALQILIIVSVFLFVVRRAADGWAVIGLRAVNRNRIIAALVAGLLFVLIGVAFELFSHTSLARAQLSNLGMSRLSLSSFVLTLAVVGVLAPISEELLFRGVLYGWMRKRWAVAPSILASTALFAILHVEPLFVAFTFIVGLGLAGLFEWSRSLWLPILAHLINNALSVGWIFGYLKLA